jgi:hypothetical protein
MCPEFIENTYRFLFRGNNRISLYWKKFLFLFLDFFYHFDIYKIFPLFYVKNSRFSW